MKKVEPKFKLWLEADGAPVIGEGRMALLVAIDECGSLTEAARRCGISYRHAYNLIKSMNKRCGCKMIETKVGGSDGGWSQLSKDAERLVREYATLKRALAKLISDSNTK